MVRRHSAKRALACLAALLALGLAGCAAGRDAEPSPQAPGVTPGAEQSAAPTEEAPKWVIHPPLVPPEGQAYDVWKDIRYTQQTVFDVTLGWLLYDRTTGQVMEESRMRAYNYTLDPPEPLARFEIAEVRAEPIGGEMKLRSGGYVDITVRAVMSSDNFRYSFDASAKNSSPDLYDMDYGDLCNGFRFSDPVLAPFDLYTGVSLLNYIEDEDDTTISNGEATDSGFVESHVSWEGRSYRLLAREDHRNTSVPHFSYSEQSDRIAVSAPVSTEVVYTFRLPADYDGLALCCPKRVECELPDPQDVTAPKQIYADILTTGDGETIPVEDCWFIRVSDLVRQFEDRAPEA